MNLFDSIIVDLVTKGDVIDLRGDNRRETTETDQDELREADVAE